MNKQTKNANDFIHGCVSLIEQVPVSSLLYRRLFRFPLSMANATLKLSASHLDSIAKGFLTGKMDGWRRMEWNGMYVPHTGENYHWRSLLCRL